MMALLSALIRYIVDSLPLRAFLRSLVSHPYLTLGLGVLSPQRASQGAYRAGMVFRPRTQGGVPRAPESSPKRLEGLPGRGITQEGSRASGRLSGGFAMVGIPGVWQLPEESRLDSTRVKIRQGVNPKKEKSHNLLTAIKIMCYNPRFSGNGHFGYFVYIRFIMIYRDLSRYSRQNGHNRQKVQMGFTRHNRQIGNVGYFRHYTTLYHQFPHGRHVRQTGHQASLYHYAKAYEVVGASL